jgi:hypothetical protein
VKNTKIRNTKFGKIILYLCGILAGSTKNKLNGRAFRSRNQNLDYSVDLALPRAKYGF